VVPTAPKVAKNTWRSLKATHQNKKKKKKYKKKVAVKGSLENQRCSGAESDRKQQKKEEEKNEMTAQVNTVMEYFGGSQKDLGLQR